MGERLSAFGRAARTFFQGVIATAGLAGIEAIHTGLTSGTYDTRLLIMGALTAVVGAVVTYVFNVVAPRAATLSPSAEGLIAFVRTVIQTAAAVGLVAAWDAVYALMTAGTFNPSDLGKAAVAAGITSVVAYLHNIVDVKAAKRPRLAE